MLYSLNYIKSPNRRMRYMFYAEDDERAREYIRASLEALGVYEEEVWLEKHPHGFIFQREKLGPHYWPPKERKNGAR